MSPVHQPPRGPLKANDLSTSGALDAHHKPGHPSALVSANTADGTNDLINLQFDPGDNPPAAGAELPARHGLNWGPGDFGKHLSVMRAAAFVHMLIKRQLTKMIKEHRQRLAVRGTKYCPPDLIPATIPL